MMQNKKIKYVYPQLSPYDLGWFRISGAGLANCMFVAARAYILSEKYKCKFIAPTWSKFSIGPILRKEKDKRIYFRLFRNMGITGVLKLWLIIKSLFNSTEIYSVRGLGNYFVDLNENYHAVRIYYDRIIRKDVIKSVDSNELKNIIAVHIRLGDYVPSLRVDINWYKLLIEDILQKHPKQKFYVFSDGTDEELQSVLSLNNVRRKFYGNALADMYAISKCKLLIASDSTFSAWGSYLGYVPIIFNKRHFPPIYGTDEKEAVIGDNTNLPIQFEYLFLKDK